MTNTRHSTDPPLRQANKRRDQGAYLKVTNGQKALTGVVAHQPDIVLLDLGLPDMDGVEVSRRLREWTAIPIIILSVRDDDQNKVVALVVGADDYIAKPFCMSELFARMRIALRHAGTADTHGGWKPCPFLF